MAYVRHNQDLVSMSRLREHLIGKGIEEEVADALLLVAQRTLDILDGVFMQYFDNVETQIDEPELGMPHFYIDGMVLGMGLYLKFLPLLFPEVSEAHLREVFAYRDHVETTPLVPEEPSPGDGPS